MSSEAPGTMAEALREFNRKERYWLIRDAILKGKPTFEWLPGSVNNPFLTKLLNELNLIIGKTLLPNGPIYWAFDYHIDWIFGAITYWIEKTKGPFDNLTDRRVVEDHDLVDMLKKRNKSGQFCPRMMTGTQQDVDFLMCWSDCLVLVEAKGVGKFHGSSSIQIRHKLRRIQSLAERFPHLKIVFATTSPDQEAPTLDFVIESIGNLNWGAEQLPHVILSGPNSGLLTTQRCKETSKSSGKYKRAADGNSWRCQ